MLFNSHIQPAATEKRADYNENSETVKQTFLLNPLQKCSFSSPTPLLPLVLRLFTLHPHSLFCVFSSMFELLCSVTFRELGELFPLLTHIWSANNNRREKHFFSTLNVNNSRLQARWWKSLDIFHLKLTTTCYWEGVLLLLKALVLGPWSFVTFFHSFICSTNLHGTCSIE